MATTSTPPFSENALNRFRLTHPDSTRAVTKRLNRLPYVLSASAPDAEADTASEAEIARLEVQRWRFGVERTLASVRSLDRQGEEYRRKAGDTAAQTALLRQTIAAEKAQLAAEQAERDHRMRCDDVAKKILSRGSSRAELDTQIAALQSSISDHRARFDEVVAIAQLRAETFSRINALVEECRALKMPAYDEDEPTPASPSPSPAPTPAPSTSASVGASAPLSVGNTSSQGARLSATTLPFQPTRSAPSSRASTPAPSVPTSASSGPSSYASHGPGHGLPARPGRAASARFPSSSAPRANLPQRPSTLRNVTGTASGASLEDGEVGEEGEVKESGKRKAVDDGRGARLKR